MLQRMRQRQITYRWRERFPVPVSELWALVSNSDRIDQAVGLPATTFRQVIRPDGLAVLEASATFLGMPFRWTELPFEWSFEQWFKVERVFANTSFVHSVVTGASFKPLGPNTTELEVQALFTPCTFVGALFIRLVAGRYMPRLGRLYRQVAENHLRNAADPYPRVRPSAVADEQLSRALDQLRHAPLSGDLVDRLATLLRDGDEREVVRMRPFVLADRWGADRLKVLCLFLYATRAGLVDANWDVFCPNCRVEKASFGALSELRPDVHCEVCNITYDANFDEYVELRFSVCHDVRVAKVATYCIAGPGNLPHILAQVRVPPKSVTTLTAPFAPGGYHFRVRGGLERGTVKVGEGGDSSGVSIRYGIDGLAPLELQVQAGIRTLQVANERDHEILLLVEKDAWGTQGASAALVTSLQDFRSLFSAEVLSPGVSVAIRNLTVLFSDLKGSTRLYTEIGDSPAYAQVRDHFDVLTRTITRHNGAW